MSNTPPQYTGKVLHVTDLAVKYGLPNKASLRDLIGKIDRNKYPDLHKFFRKTNLKRKMTHHLVNDVIEIIGHFKEYED